MEQHAVSCFHITRGPSGRFTEPDRMYSVTFCCEPANATTSWHDFQLKRPYPIY